MSVLSGNSLRQGEGRPEAAGAGVRRQQGNRQRLESIDNRQFVVYLHSQSTIAELLSLAKNPKGKDRFGTVLRNLPGGTLH